jgi:hypothetical protein
MVRQCYYHSEASDAFLRRRCEDCQRLLPTLLKLLAI